MAGLPVQCEGATRSGRRCTITSDSKLRDGEGRLVAAPLRFGGRCCGFHASVFCSRRVRPSGHLLACFLDFETTGSSFSGLSQLSSRGLAVNMRPRRCAGLGCRNRARRGKRCVLCNCRPASLRTKRARMQQQRARHPCSGTGSRPRLRNVVREDGGLPRAFAGQHRGA